MKVKKGVGDLQSTDGDICSDSEKKANQQNVFCSVYTTEDMFNIPIATPKCNNVCKTVPITEDIIYKTSKELNPYKPAGPDKIHPRVLKETSATITKPVFEIC